MGALAGASTSEPDLEGKHHTETSSVGSLLTCGHAAWELLNPLQPAPRSRPLHIEFTVAAPSLFKEGASNTLRDDHGFMSSATTTSLHQLYAAESANIRQRFESSGNGGAVLSERTALVDSITRELFHEIVSPTGESPKGFALAALGGFGRKVLFPHSDIDLLFLVEDSTVEPLYKNKVARMCRELWDIGVRVSPTTRTLAECGQLHRENLELNISLLDSRYLAGDGSLFAALHEKTIPRMVLREATPLVQNLAELTRARHEKFGRTIFHLEPNIKDGPGGIRDYNVICWLELIRTLERRQKSEAPPQLRPVATGDDVARAFAFLSAARCFLHYHLGRDVNSLTYDSQNGAGSAGVGLKHGAKISPADWMREYFRHSRAIYQLVVQVLDEVPPARSSLYSVFRGWRSRLSNANFSVVDERVFLKQPAAMKDPDLILALFEFLARHGFRLSGEAERHVKEALDVVHSCAPHVADYWPRLRQILSLPHAADALRAMHRLGILVALFPEFRLIDSLVIRDFYHRYTVDEHSFMTIETLHDLDRSTQPLRERYLEIRNETERTDLLYLALLFHDVGKGMENESHVEGSLQVLERVLERLKLAPSEAETVRFLVASHLLMSATLLRRDIFDPETVRSFAQSVGSIENLKLLTLFTYADIASVNPEALTPWKAETLWQLYAETANYLNRSVDGQRVRLEQQHAKQIERIHSIVPETEQAALNAFLEGFPTRCLLTHTPDQIARHFNAAQQGSGEPVHLVLEQHNHSYELTLLTKDRPYLFATVAGAIAAWGMNIIKADAFSNHAGLALDTFRFSDLFSTLDLNPSEAQRFERHMIEVVSGERDVDEMLAGRLKNRPRSLPKMKIETQVWFDNESSSTSTILELVTRDRPGLLYSVASQMAELACNIEIALIDTEGQKAIDVFYLTRKAKKLGPKTESKLREALLNQLSD